MSLGHCLTTECFSAEETCACSEVPADSTSLTSATVQQMRTGASSARSVHQNPAVVAMREMGRSTHNRSFPIMKAGGSAVPSMDLVGLDYAEPEREFCTVAVVEFQVLRVQAWVCFALGLLERSAKMDIQIQALDWDWIAEPG